MTGRKITFFIPSLAGGGAERVAFNLAQTFADKDYAVTLLVQQAEGPLRAHVPANVRLVSLDAKRTLQSLLPLIRYMKRENPDIFIANLGHANVISLWARILTRCSIRLIACQHNLLSGEVETHKTWQYRLLPLLYRLFLPRADNIVAVSRAVAEDLARCAHIPRERITVIYNPIIGRDFSEKMSVPAPYPWLQDKDIPVVLGIGRLVPRKDFPTLIRAFTLALAKRPMRLMIIGDGPLRRELETLILNLGIEKSAMLVGFQNNPLPFMRAASLVVLPSLYEGLGNVLIEALACGTPVIATDTPGGHKEILDGGHYGVLVPPQDAGKMAKAILDMLDKPKDSQTLMQYGQGFTFERAAVAYEALF